MAGNHQRQAKVVSKISLPGPRQHRFPNPPRAPLHARPIRGIGYAAGLEIWAANTKSVAQPQDGYFAHMEKCVG